MKTLTVNAINEIEDLKSQPINAIDMVNWPEFPHKPQTTFQIARLGDKIAIRYQVHETDPRVANHEDFGSVWEDSCVEFFVKLPESNRYCNFEFNSDGVALATSRISRSEDVVKFTPEQMASIVRMPENGDGWWALTVEIPLKLFGAEEAYTLMANFYKCGDCTAVPHFLSWNPIDVKNPDFHRPEYFGKLNIAK